MDGASQGDVHREDVDGVPVYWAAGAPRFTGALMFRVGVADESVLNRGITHFVEHLVLFGLGPRQSYECNGFVDGNRVVFHATGSPEEVASFFAHVCAAIGSLPVKRADAEARVLRTEASQREPGVFERLMWYRFGARHHGLVTIREHALDAPDPGALQAWATERFTRENAAAWFSGPIPPGLRFDALPGGRRVTCPEPFTLPEIATPAVLFEQPGGLAISFLADRDTWIGIPWQIAVRRLQERLRHREGLAYQFLFEYHPVSGKTAHSTLWAGCLDEHARAVMTGLIDVLHDLTEKGPTVEEIREVRQDYVKYSALPEATPQHLDSATVNDLYGRPHQTWQDQLLELDEMTPESCAAAARAAMATAILTLPPACEAAPKSFRRYPAWSRAPVQGRRFRSTSQKYPWSPKRIELIVGKDGLSLVTPQGNAVTVLYESCAGAVCHPDGALYVVGNDGFNLWVRPGEWQHGEQARQAILDAVPPGQLLSISAR